MFMASVPLAVILNKLHRKLGEKQGSVQFNVAEVTETSWLTFNIVLTAIKYYT